ncbi:hypothetical protein BS17DRAFT_719160 [Gyrodon lividus]|nr:hypothetical protein BS17DRAFT_719160 [Gyrodon lividus]
MQSTCADDSARLKDKVGYYAAPNPTVASLSPPIYPGSSKSQWGLNHPVLASFLCPIVSLVEFHKDPKKYVPKFDNHTMIGC